MAEINPYESPDVLSPEPFAPLAGDWTDDDATAIDQKFEAASHEPLTYGSDPATADHIPTPTRILSRALTIGLFDGVSIADPVQVFPIDTNRKQLIVQATSGNVVIGSDKSDLYNGAFVLAVTQWSSSEHTGALWIYAPTAVAPVTVTVWSVTR